MNVWASARGVETEMCQPRGQPDIWLTAKKTHKSQPDSKKVEKSISFSCEFCKTCIFWGKMNFTQSFFFMMLVYAFLKTGKCFTGISNDSLYIYTYITFKHQQRKLWNQSSQSMVIKIQDPPNLWAQSFATGVKQFRFQVCVALVNEIAGEKWRGQG